MNKTEVAEIYSSIDTIITFNPDTYEETVQIVKNDLKYDEIQQFRLVQEWYFDQQRNQLMNRLRAIAPVVQIKRPDGKIIYSRPIYYIHYRYEKLN